MKNEFRAFRIASFSVATNWSVVWDANGGSPYAVHYDLFLPAVSACGVSSKNENRFESPARRAGAGRVILIPAKP